MKKIITTAILALTAITAQANTPKQAVIHIPPNAIPTAYVCDGVDIEREKVVVIVHKADGTVDIKYNRKNGRKPVTTHCTKEFAKVYG